MDPDLAAGPPEALAETCRVVAETIPLWHLHRQRLAAGGCGAPMLERIEEAIGAAVAGYIGGWTSRVRLHLEVKTDGSVSVELKRALSSLDVVGGPAIAPVALSDLPPMPALPAGGAKPADRSWWDEAARRAQRQRAHQALIVDESGNVLDGSSASVWVLSRGELATPPSPSAVGGVARRFMLDGATELARSAGVSLIERPISLDEISRADEVLLTNAFGGAVAVRGRGGPVSDAVGRLFATVWAMSARAS